MSVMGRIKAECLIQFSIIKKEGQQIEPGFAQRVILTKLHNIFGITLELVGSRSSVSFDEAGLYLSYTVEANDKKELEEKSHQLINKLNLLASIQSGEEIKPFTFRELLVSQELTNIDSIDNLFYGVEPKLFQHFLLDSNFEEFFVLIEAFNDLKNNRIFDAFPKFVNWLDFYDYEDGERKPQYKFCVLRTALSHTQLTNADKVKRLYPKIEFSGNIFVRNQHNENILLSLVSELLDAVKKRFREILVNYVA